MATNNKPVHEVRLGHVKATVWLNETQAGPRHNVTVARLYKDDKQQWKTSDSFGREDLLLLAKVADLTHSWIYDHGQEKAAVE